MTTTQPTSVNCTMLVRGAERYVFLWRRQDATELLRVFGSFAGDTELSFTWLDAARLSQRVQEELRKESAT